MVALRRIWTRSCSGVGCWPRSAIPQMLGVPRQHRGGNQDDQGKSDQRGEQALGKILGPALSEQRRGEKTEQQIDCEYFQRDRNHAQYAFLHPHARLRLKRSSCEAMMIV